MAQKPGGKPGWRATWGKRGSGEGGAFGAETCLHLEIKCAPAGNWGPRQGVYGGRAGRQRASKPHIPPPALTSHPEASGKGKSMGSLSALGSVAGI